MIILKKIMVKFVIIAKNVIIANINMLILDTSSSTSLKRLNN